MELHPQISKIRGINRRNFTRHFKDDAISNIVWPDVDLRNVGHVVRTTTVIPDYKAVVDKNTGHTFAIVKNGYKLVHHQDVLEQLDEICNQFPEYGTPSREVWLDRQGGKMRARWVFNGIDFEIAPGDVVHPTIETLGSYDTSFAQRTQMGGYRLVCSNGMMVGKILAAYQRKHTAGLDMNVARMVLSDGMNQYSETVGLWRSFIDRNAISNEVFCYETIGFNKEEKLHLEAEVRRTGKVIQWDDEKPDERKVEINAWDMYNLLTWEASHTVNDLQRQVKINDGIASTFGRVA